MAVKLLEEKDAKSLVSKLEGAYRDAKYYLNFKTPVGLLVAAILSAQTHDTVVNAVTPTLFSKYREAEDYARAKPEELLAIVGRVSYARNKVLNIINACKLIDEKYAGRVPRTAEQLVELPGIGSKTANTILINAYGIVNGIPVDTWVIKLSYRLGLSQNKNPDKIEKDLERVVDRKYWHNFAYVLKAHGKNICGVVPKCSICPVSAVCPRNGVTKST